MLAPKLRFKEFNDEWKKVKINKILKIKHGKNQKEIECINGKYPILGTGGIIGTTNTPAYLKESVLIGRKGTIDKPMYINIPFWTVDTLFYSDVSSNYNVKFIYYLFNTINWKKYDESTGVPSLSANTIENIDVNISLEKEEQLKISQFLSLFDKKIELQQRKIEVLKMYKKGLFQKILNYEGEKRKISEILEEVVEKSTENNQYDVISSTKEGLILQKEYFNRNIASENNIGYKILRNNQIVLSPQNLWMGNINYNDKYCIGIVSPSYKIFDIKEGYSKEYIASLLKTNRALYMYKISSEQGASIVRRNLNMDAFYEITFKIPSLKEQIKYGEIIKKLNRKIDNMRDTLNMLLKIKKGLLQQMFI